MFYYELKSYIFNAISEGLKTEHISIGIYVYSYIKLRPIIVLITIYICNVVKKNIIFIYK